MVALARGKTVDVVQVGPFDRLEPFLGLPAARPVGGLGPGFEDHAVRVSALAPAVERSGGDPVGALAAHRLRHQLADGPVVVGGPVEAELAAGLPRSRAVEGLVDPGEVPGSARHHHAVGDLVVPGPAEVVDVRAHGCGVDRDGGVAGPGLLDELLALVGAEQAHV